MADKLDKSLDQIITSNKQRGGKVGGGRGGVRGKSVQARVARGGRVGANTNIKRGAQGRQFNNRTQQNVQASNSVLHRLSGGKVGGRGGKIIKAQAFEQKPRSNAISRPNPRPVSANGNWNHDLFYQNVNELRGQRQNAAGRSTGAIHITNLHFDVLDSDLKTIFSKEAQVNKVVVHYDKSGRSLGTADVIFSTRSEAIKVAKKYNNAKINGQQVQVNYD